MTGASKNKGCAKQNAVLGHSRTPKTGKFLQLEEQLFKYFEKTQNNSSYKHMDSTIPNIVGKEFKARRTLINRFMKRKNLSLRSFIKKEKVTVPEDTN
jgi:hypothetical protein